MIRVAINLQRRNAGQQRGEIHREKPAVFQQLAAEPIEAIVCVVVSVCRAPRRERHFDRAASEETAATTWSHANSCPPRFAPRSNEPVENEDRVDRAVSIDGSGVRSECKRARAEVVRILHRRRYGGIDRVTLAALEAGGFDNPITTGCVRNGRASRAGREASPRFVRWPSGLDLRTCFEIVSVAIFGCHSPRRVLL